LKAQSKTNKNESITFFYLNFINFQMNKNVKDKKRMTNY
jgi:hypothetical protein